MYAQNSLWVCVSLAADCKTAWFHPECEDTVAIGCMKKWKDKEKRRGEKHQKPVRRMISRAGGGACFLHRITKPAALRRFAGSGRVGRNEERVWAKHWECDSEVQGMDGGQAMEEHGVEKLGRTAAEAKG